MTTEAEAKEKWCPFARNVMGTGSAFKHQYYNRIDPGLPLNVESTCLGARCMAWRWEMVHDGTFNVTLTGPTLEVQERVPNFRPSDRGRCGLAGKEE